MRSDLDVVLDRAPKAVEYRPLPKVAQRVPHRCQQHYEDHLAEVKQCQEELRSLLVAAESCNSPEELRVKHEEIAEQRDRIEKKIVLVKITSKILAEVKFAREALREAVRLGNSTTDIRQRIGWLEQRLDRLLDKERPEQVRPKLAILPPPPKNLEEAEQKEEKKEETEVARKVSKMTTEVKKEPDKEMEKEPDKEMEKEPDKEMEKEPDKEMEKEPDKEAENKVEKDKTGQDMAPEKIDDTFLTEFPDDKSLDLDLSDSASSGNGEAVPEAAAEDEDLELGMARETTEDALAADDYWASEHHRVKFAENAEVLLQLDPSSYHSLAMVQPGTYVAEANDGDPTLPWRPRRRDSEFEEIHESGLISAELEVEKDALNLLSKRVHNLYSEVHDAAMLSVDPHYKDQVVKGTFIDNLAAGDKDIVADTELALPEVRMPKKAGAGAVYYPTPLLPPVKLPQAKLDRHKVFPPGPAGYSSFELDTDRPAERVVNQGNLYEDTKFTSSLFRRRRGHSNGTRVGDSAAEEQRLRKWLRESGTPPTSRGGAPFLLRPEDSSDLRPTFRNRALAIRGAQKFAKTLSSEPKPKQQLLQEVFAVGGALWKNMKPKSGALHHSGLKWERIKAIVHHNLNSPRPLERQDAARSLGLLRCADAMVLFALRKSMISDEDLQTRFEATKALLLLGCWEDSVLQHAVFFLRRGAANVKSHLLRALTTGKNVQFVDKRLATFPKLSQTLTDLTVAGDPEVAFQAAVCLGKLCVVDATSKNCLLKFLTESQDDDRIVQACESLVRQMNCTEPVVVDTVLHRLRWSPKYKNRSLCARLLVAMGPRVVCEQESDRDRVFELLETRIWDDPMPDVRTDIAKAIIALDMFPRTCEKTEKKLESSDEGQRAQAVMAIGTLGIRNERIIRTLLEMLELDPSEYIRILVIRTFGAIGLADKRIIRSLQEKEKLEAMFANRSAISSEARKSLKLLQNAPPS